MLLRFDLNNKAACKPVSFQEYKPHTFGQAFDKDIADSACTAFSLHLFPSPDPKEMAAPGRTGRRRRLWLSVPTPRLAPEGSLGRSLASTASRRCA